MGIRTTEIAHHLIHGAALLFAIVLALCVTACERSAPGARNPEQPVIQDSQAENKNQTEIENYIEQGDLEAIKKRGLIRFVSMTGDSQPILPREAIINQTHRQMAEDFAKRIGLPSRWYIAQTPEQALKMVNDGEVDIVAENISITPERQEAVAFSIPILQTSDVLITGASGPDISKIENLKGTEFIVLAGSTYADQAHAIVSKYPDANLTVREVYLSDERDTLFDMVAEVDNAVTILHGNLAKETLEYRDDLKVGTTVGPQENIGWAIRKDSVRLKNRINNFLTRTLVTAAPERTSHWYAIKKSGVLRFATYNGPTSYYLWKGVLRGFDYDMAKAFADKHKLQLQVVVVPNEDDLVDWVVDGRADIAGASTTITQDRLQRGVEFSTPFLETTEKIISNRNTPKMDTIADLQGRTLTLRAYSSFIETARELRESGIDIRVQVAPATMSFEEILNHVAEGLFEATIEDGYIADIQTALRPELVIGLQVNEGQQQGWMVKQGHKDLLRRVNRFLKRFSKSEEFDKLLTAYFKPDPHLTQKIAARVIPGQPLSPYDKIVQSSSLEHDFDWRLIVAQMWQESNFNPNAVSPVGAQGLLQVMPRTGEDMGYPPPLFDPEKNVKAGVKYMEWVRNRFKDPLPASEQLWFTLASYNAGLGHLLDAQRLAEELGLDPSKWFDNVEVAMLKLSEPQYFEKARYGYVRGSEPVAYVRKISQLYQAYTNVATGDLLTKAGKPSKSPLSWVMATIKSCQYADWIPSDDVRPPRLPARMWRQSGGAVCPPQSLARPELPDRGQSMPSPPTAVDAE